MRRAYTFVRILYVHEVCTLDYGRRENPIRRRNSWTVPVVLQQLNQLVAYRNGVRPVAFGDCEPDHFPFQVEIIPFQSFDASFPGASEECREPPHALDRSQ